jgi:hypothetical protein
MVSQVRAYLMTRGFPRGLDYRFLGAAPPEPWWTPLRDRELVNLERTEFIAHGAAAGLGLLLSGIPSVRRDVVGTPIRYTLVVDGLGDAESDALLARRLVLAGLRDPDRQALGRALDAAFDQAAVDEILAGARDAAQVGDVVAEVLAKGWGAGDAAPPGGGPDAASTGTASTNTGPADVSGSWAGPAGAEQAGRDFLARVAALAAGGQGFAFTSGTLVTERGVRAALGELPGTNVILLRDGELTEVVRLGKAVATVARRRGELVRRIPEPLTRPVVLASSGGALLVAIAIVLLVLLL